jgi:hypothetical protein
MHQKPDMIIHTLQYIIFHKAFGASWPEPFLSTGRNRLGNSFAAILPAI